MKQRVLFFLLVLVLSFSSLGGVKGVSAAARTFDWSVAVFYQNVGSSGTQVRIDIYDEAGGLETIYEPTDLIEPGGTASFFAGDISDLSAGFRGNAVLSASEPMAATAMYYQPDPTQKLRMFSNGFSLNDGSNQFLIATTLKNMWDRTTVFSVQNIENEQVTVTLNFYAASDGSLVNSETYNIPANSSKHIEMDVLADTGLSANAFNGSLIIDAEKGDGSPAKVVATANELYTDRNVGASFGGMPLSRASDKIYLSTGLCGAFDLDTYYAVQNTSYTDPVEFIVQYFNKNGQSVTSDGPYTIGPGQKRSIRTCDPSSGKNMSGFTGSAVITTTDPDSKIVALGKAQTLLSEPSSTYNVFTIFNGEERGYSRIAFPYVRWANDTRFTASSNMGTNQRTYIAVKNLEPTASKVNVIYYGADGAIVGTHVLTVPANSKVNTSAYLANALGKGGMSPGEFGYYPDGSFGGGAILEAHPDNPAAEFIAIVRVQHPGWGEDYNGIGLVDVD
jgi:hypothetical protein